jgi:predicted metal-dependent hydrolase
LPQYDRLYVEFLYYFNIARDYFECHEVMEELWLGEGRSPLLQGLLQVAVGLYHHGNGNVSGAVKLLTAALEKLEPQPADALGIDLARLRRDSADYLARLRRMAIEPFEPYDLDIAILDPALKTAVEALQADPPHKGET